MESQRFSFLSGSRSASNLASLHVQRRQVLPGSRDAAPGAAPHWNGASEIPAAARGSPAGRGAPDSPPVGPKMRPPCREYPTTADAYELVEECGRGVSATVSPRRRGAPRAGRPCTRQAAGASAPADHCPPPRQQVWRAICKPHSEEVAVKLMDLENMQCSLVRSAARPGQAIRQAGGHAGAAPLPPTVPPSPPAAAAALARLPTAHPRPPAAGRDCA
jgi:hypothetical protein